MYNEHEEPKNEVLTMMTRVLNNNMIVPAIGFGTCKHSFDQPIDDIIMKAMESGYRYFDTASFYETERDLGKAIRNSGLKRDELTIATKLWYEEMGFENAQQAFFRSQERLGLDYVDVYMIHWPKASADDENWKGTLVETWAALEDLKEKGLIKAIGVSNFLPHHLKVIFDNFRSKPVVDQLELHLGYFQEYAVRFLQENDILTQAWSPIGRGKDAFKANRILNGIAERYNVSVQKLSLRFLIQRGVMPLPWSTSTQHIKDNLDVFGFEISEEDMSLLSCMPQETWLGEHPDFYLPMTKHVKIDQ